VSGEGKKVGPAHQQTVRIVPVETLKTSNSLQTISQQSKEVVVEVKQSTQLQCRQGKSLQNVKTINITKQPQGQPIVGKENER